MSETVYAEGDLVEAVKGEKVARSRLIESRHKCNTGAFGLYLNGFERIPFANSNESGRNGWTFTVIEKAKPPLPTEPGIYADDMEDIWRIGESGRLICLTNEVGANMAHLFVPFTKLEPVAETAKRVLDRLFSADIPNRNEVAAEFGVTS